MNPGYQSKHSYLIRYSDGRWVHWNNVVWRRSSTWSPDITDVIWLKTGNIISNYWDRRDGMPAHSVVDEKDILLYMLQADHIIPLV